MHTRLRSLRIALLGCCIAAVSSSACDYYVKPRAHGATYFGYARYYYQSTYRPQLVAYTPPRVIPYYASAIGGGPTSGSSASPSPACNASARPTP